MKYQQKARAMLRLTYDLQHKLSGNTLAAFAPDFLARLEDRQDHIAEMAELAAKTETNKAIIRFVDDLLDRRELDGLPNKAHYAIIGKKRDLEGTIKSQEKQLAGMSELESGIIRDAVKVTAMIEAERRGCLNSGLAAVYVMNTSKAELLENGSLKMTFLDEQGGKRYSKCGDSMTIRDAIDYLVDENPNLFGGNGGKGTKVENPWLPEQFNLTRQGMIFRDNPALAKQLQTQANQTSSVSCGNPFLEGKSFNLTEQGRLVREKPELARRLAAEAGIKLSI